MLQENKEKIQLFTVESYPILKMAADKNGTITIQQHYVASVLVIWTEDDHIF